MTFELAAATDNIVDPRSILEFLEPAFAGLRSTRSLRLLEQIGIDDHLALHLVFVYLYEKQLFYIVSYRWTVPGYSRHTFGWVNSKNLILLL